MRKLALAHMRKLALASALAALAALTGCSSAGSGSSSNPSASASGGTPSSASGGTSSSSPSASAAGAAGVAQARALVAKYTANPSGIGVTQPLSKKPAPGKLIVGLVGPNPVSTVISDAAATAAQSLGWTYKAISLTTDPQATQEGFETALALSPKPYAIIVTGVSRAQYATQLAQAKSDGVAVVAEASPDLGGTGNGIVANISGPTSTALSSKLLAAEVIADSDGTAHVALFSSSAFQILNYVTGPFEQTMSQWCPKCTVKLVNQQPTDIGTQTPGSVVSTFQSDPTLNYAAFAIGDFATGVDPALRAAGLSGSVKVVGTTASNANIAALKTGAEYAWTGYPDLNVGWLSIDAIARYSVGDSVTVDDQALNPLQVFTKANVDSIVTNPAGYWLGTASYAAQWKKLWLLG